MNLHGGSDSRIQGHAQVRVPPSDVAVEKGISVGQGFEELPAGVAVAVRIGEVVDQGVGGAVNLFSGPEKDDVVIASQSRALLLPMVSSL